MGYRLRSVKVLYIVRLILKADKSRRLASSATEGHPVIQISGHNVEELIAASDYLGIASLKQQCCEVGAQRLP